MRDLYSVLNLSRRASSKDIKAAYWALAKQFHPDVNASDQKRRGGSKKSITLTRSWGILNRARLTTSNWRASAPRRGEASGVRQQQAQQPSC